MLSFIDFWTRLLQTNVIIGIIIAILGFGLVLLAKKIVQAKRRSDYVEEKDKSVMALRGFGLVFIAVAMFIMIIQ